jgi:uncharacterized membrane protein
VKPADWFGLIIAYTALTVICVVFIPSDSLLSLIRIVLAFVFVAVAPGYCLISLLFQEGKLDLAERAVLSVALSFAIAGVSGLFLGISPIGITVTSIVETLFPIEIILAVLAFLRKAGLLKIPALSFRRK